MTDCPGCGLGSGPLVPSPACADHALVVAEREFSDPAYFAVHRTTVAAYCLQHPDASSDHAVAVHLVALRGAVEHGLAAEDNARRIRWAAGRLRAHPPGHIPRPDRRGTLTIAEVAAARDAVGHCAIVREWATQVWAGWRSLPQVAQLTGEAGP